MSEAIEGIRREIDQLDEEIVQRLARRFGAARRIGQLKVQEGMEQFDAAREEAILKHILAAANDEMMRESLRVIYQTLLAESKRYQTSGRER